MGFGYERGDYVARVASLPLTKRLRIDRRVHKNEGIDAYSIDVTVAYPFHETDAGIVPSEVGCVRSDSRAWYVPNREERDLYIDSKDLERLVLSGERCAMGWLQAFFDAELMLKLIAFLSGEAEVIAPFEYLATDPYIKRLPTASLISSKSAYLNVAGRFDEAIQALNDPLMDQWRDGVFQRKLYSDASHKRVEISSAYIERLRSAGASL